MKRKHSILLGVILSTVIATTLVVRHVYIRLTTPFERLNDNEKEDFMLGMQYLTEDNFSLAKEHLLNFLEDNREFPRVYLGLGLIYEEEKDYKSAERIYIQGIKQIEHNEKICVAYVDLNTIKGDFDKARTILRSNECAMPTDKDVWHYKIGLTHYLQGEWQTALKEFERASDIDPSFRMYEGKEIKEYIALCKKKIDELKENNLPNKAL